MDLPCIEPARGGVGHFRNLPAEDVEIVQDWLVPLGYRGVAPAVPAHRSTEGDMQVEGSGVHPDPAQPMPVLRLPDLIGEFRSRGIARVTWQAGIAIFGDEVVRHFCDPRLSSQPTDH